MKLVVLLATFLSCASIKPRPWSENEVLALAEECMDSLAARRGAGAVSDVYVCTCNSYEVSKHWSHEDWISDRKLTEDEIATLQAITAGCREFARQQIERALELGI